MQIVSNAEHEAGPVHTRGSGVAGTADARVPVHETTIRLWDNAYVCTVGRSCCPAQRRPGSDLCWRRYIAVNKSELIEHIANQADISKAAATRALEAFLGGVTKSLKKGDSVTLVGFGTFAVTKRAARTGRNPRTGATIKLKAAKVPKFRAGKALKDALN